MVREYRVFEIAGNNTRFFCARFDDLAASMAYIRMRVRKNPEERFITEAV